jgi:hypothetical protein
VWLQRGTLVPWGVTTRKPAFGVILLGLLCEQCSTSRPDRLDYPHSRPFRRRQLGRKADYAWHLAASVRLQIAKPLRMSATGLRSGVLNDLFRNDFGHRVAAIIRLRTEGLANLVADLRAVKPEPRRAT